jgi:hypothetical protein
MNKRKLVVVGCLLALMLAVSVVSAKQTVTQSLALAPSAETQAVGGLSGDCLKALGLTSALALAGVGGCEVLCFCLAWYSLGAVAVYCG